MKFNEGRNQTMKRILTSGEAGMVQPGVVTNTSSLLGFEVPRGSLLECIGFVMLLAVGVPLLVLFYWFLFRLGVVSL